MKRNLSAPRLVAALVFPLGMLALVAFPPARADTGSPSKPLDVIRHEKYLSEGGTPNPAVLKMDSAQYIQTLNGIHPVLTGNNDQLDAAIRYGSLAKDKSFLALAKPWRKEVGGYRDVVWVSPPYLLAAFASWSDAKIGTQTEDSTFRHFLLNHYLTFHLDMSRPHNPTDFKNMRFVLEGGDGKRYQPVAHPPITEITESIEERSTFDVQVGPGIEASPSEKKGSFPLFSTVSRGVFWGTSVRNKRWYRAWYTTSFDLLNADGTPRFGPDTKSLTLIMTTNGREKKCKFALANWDSSGLVEKQN